MMVAGGASVLANIIPLNEKIAFVQRLPLFSSVSATDCGTIISTARERSLRRHQTIFCEGEPVQQIFVLLSGCVKITQLGLRGDEVILRLCGVGDAIGGFQLTTNCNQVSTAQAVQPSTALVWQVTSFERLLERFPDFRCNTVRALDERLRELEQRFREVSTEKVVSRLSSELIRLSNRLGQGVNGSVEISLSHAELAQLTGTTLFTVSRLLCQWQTLGIVSIRRETIRVRDLAALTQLAQSE
jgi:CRP-like cAMP-binding protein